MYVYCVCVLLQAARGPTGGSMRFWQGVGQLMEGRTAEAMRELQASASHMDMSLASSLALVYAHKQEKIVDQQAVKELEQRVKSGVRTCGEAALVQAAQFLFTVGRNDKARDLVDRALKRSKTNVAAKKKQHKNIRYTSAHLLRSGLHVPPELAPRVVVHHRLQSERRRVRERHKKYPFTRNRHPRREEQRQMEEVIIPS